MSVLPACIAVHGESFDKSDALRIPQTGEEPLAHGALQGQSTPCIDCDSIRMGATYTGLIGYSLGRFGSM